MLYLLDTLQNEAFQFPAFPVYLISIITRYYIHLLRPPLSPSNIPLETPVHPSQPPSFPITPPPPRSSSLPPRRIPSGTVRHWSAYLSVSFRLLFTLPILPTLVETGSGAKPSGENQPTLLAHNNNNNNNNNNGPQPFILRHLSFPVPSFCSCFNQIKSAEILGAILNLFYFIYFALVWGIRN